MNRLIFRLLPLLLALIFGGHFRTFATHQRAAEITYRHLSDLTYEITLISYTFTPSPANAYRDNLTINWGDGTFSEIPRVEIVYLPDDITFNRYLGQHTFPGPSTYTIGCEDPNRNGGILNIPNSINTPLYIYSELTINPFIGGYNNSPVLLLPPIDNACVNQPFYHNPGAYDADSDSLSYRLVPCRGAQGQVIPGYTYPPASHSLTLNPTTGDLIWDSPEQQGEFNIAILIEEWRNGVKIGSVLRDMQIIVIACNNHPPVIEPLPDTCVEAGKILRFQIRTYDPDSNNVTLTGTGGPLLISGNPAILNPNPATGQGHTQSVFRWETGCNNVQRRPYQMFFKSKDNASPVSLVTIKSMNIIVVGPAPQNLAAQPLGNTIRLNWDAYPCENALGYQVYRKADSSGFLPGNCETGVPPDIGYIKIAEFSGITNNFYLDDNRGTGLQRGIKYCYMVVAYYPGRAESYASNEACATLKKDVPVITNTSVNSTNFNSGSLFVAWSKPTEIDTLQAPGPYCYIVARSRSDAPSQFALIDSLFSLNDTLMTDSLQNTQEFGFNYRIDLYNISPGNRFLIGSSQVASSMFLSAAPTDKMVKLSWSNEVPWANHSFVIYRKDPGSVAFDSVGTSTSPGFHDTGLINGMEYCYKIKSIGKYSASGFVDPILNFSQETCAIPVDNIPPCPPLLTIKSVCAEYTNILTWTKPADSCPADIAGYYIYFTPGEGTPVLYDSILNPADTFYYHKQQNTIVGCYAVSAVDSVGNISVPGNIVCVDISAGLECEYSLPNVFTPNGDSFNDYFRPIHNFSVDEVNMKIFDRWGKEVFETKDPAINWDGKDKTTNQPCSDGTYFYVCDIFEITLTGKVQRNLHGSITILR